VTDPATTVSPSPPLHRPTVVFLDRDGTVIRDVHYLSRPEQVELLPGAAESIARLNEAKIPVIMITNQSGIARGYFTVADYERSHARLVELLAAQKAHLDATYYCPDPPDAIGPGCCRKPGTLLFHRAIKEHGLDATSPVFIGDRWRDLAPMNELGGHAYLVISPDTPPVDLEQARKRATIVASFAEAVSELLGIVPPTSPSQL
jgi:histidinol-phosphate phosphatase family protein